MFIDDSCHLASYDLHTIHSIINATPVLHVSFNCSDLEDPFPTVLPMIGTMGSFEHPSADLNDPMDCYLHGYVSSGIMKQARSRSEKGLPITVAATKVDGIVLSLTPNSHSYNYRSAVLFGYGSLVEDLEEKIWAMKLVTDSVVPGRWDNTRSPPDGSEMASTTILKVKVVNGSGKVRTGGPGDEKKDTEREDVVERVWTGVIPVYESVGEPVRGGAGRVEQVPEHITSFRDEVNETNKEYARTAAAAKGSAGKGY
jgi:nitroimidazol reductase NimA-like FMN-containing flavoprotein (pyridoxamine 5'-phosphate oxidase superfamily)